MVTKRNYQLLVKTEGGLFFTPVPKFFSKKIQASTFANIETVAGMGEIYDFRKVKKKRGK